MQSKRFHLVACWLATVATLINATATSAGLVRCEGPGGEVALEAGCEHDHCEAEGLLVRADQHDHTDRAICDCVDCNCEDTAVGAEAASMAKRCLDLLVAPTPTLCAIAYPEQSRACHVGIRAPVAFDRLPPSNRTLRTVILLI